MLNVYLCMDCKKMLLYCVCVYLGYVLMVGKVEKIVWIIWIVLIVLELLFYNEWFNCYLVFEFCIIYNWFRSFVVEGLYDLYCGFLV